MYSTRYSLVPDVKQEQLLDVFSLLRVDYLNVNGYVTVHLH